MTYENNYTIAYEIVERGLETIRTAPKKLIQIM
jgi:hypothetical protein